MRADDPPPSDDRLDALAGSVSDGRPVDWDGAETEAQDAGGQESVRALRDVARIVEFNRGLQRSPLPGSDPALATPEPERWGALTLLERVGAGATGEVWRAWDARLRREVALKFLRIRGTSADGVPSEARLLEEARALARVRHAGVVAVHGIAEHDGRVGLWMEFLRGPSLAEEIERRGPLPASEVARIGLELCRALEAVDAAGLVVLTDFGLGSRRGVGDGDPRRVSGTPIFMSPGLLEGDQATARSDLYALGVTLRWALTGRAPFRSTTLEELKAEAKAGPATSLAEESPGAPPALVAAIERAMAPDARDRFASASEMAAALRAALAAIEGGRGSRVRARRGIAVAAIVCAAVAAALWLAPRLSGPRTATTAGGAGAARERAAGGDAASGPAPVAVYDVEASLVNRSGGAFTRLAPGDRISPGDRLSLEFRASRSLWVYVLNEDERGETYLLFPKPLFDVANPIPADSVAILPGAIGGRENAWTVTSRGGREHFLVVASPRPVPEIEAELARLPAARPGRPIEYAAVGASTVERLRGVGGVSPLPSDAPRADAARAFERFQALAGRETVAQGIWARRITLENPLR